MRFLVLLFIFVGVLEARVVNDEYRGNTIIYSKESYNKTTVEHWEEEKQPKREYKKSYKKTHKKSYKKPRTRYTGSSANVVNDEYQGSTIRYSSEIRMTRKEWVERYKNKKHPPVYSKDSYGVVGDEYRGQ